MMKKFYKGLRGRESIFLWLSSNQGSEQEGGREELGGLQWNDLFNNKRAILWHFRALGLEDQKICQEKGILSPTVDRREPGSQSSQFKTAISFGGFKKRCSCCIQTSNTASITSIGFSDNII